MRTFYVWKNEINDELDKFEQKVAHFNEWEQLIYIGAEVAKHLRVIDQQLKQTKEKGLAPQDQRIKTLTERKDELLSRLDFVRAVLDSLTDGEVDEEEVTEEVTEEVEEESDENAGSKSKFWHKVMFVILIVGLLFPVYGHLFDPNIPDLQSQLNTLTSFGKELMIEASQMASSVVTLVKNEVHSVVTNLLNW